MKVSFVPYPLYFYFSILQTLIACSHLGEWNCSLLSSFLLVVLLSFILQPSYCDPYQIKCYVKLKSGIAFSFLSFYLKFIVCIMGSVLGLRHA